MTNFAAISDISIHVPREGDDKASKHIRYWLSYFNPRPP